MRGAPRVFALAVVLCLGCDGHQSVSSTDRETYLRAMGRVGAEAMEQCEGIAHVDLRSECQVFAAATGAQAGDAEQALALCQQMPVGVWADECYFAVADALADVRSSAKQACDQARVFANDCLAHVLLRDIRQAERRVGKPGQEAELLAEFTDMMQHYVDEPSKRQRAAEVVMAHSLATRQADLAFDAARCGVAPHEVCVSSYLIALSTTPPRADALGACDGDRSAESLAAAGIRPFVEGSESQAERAFERYCEALKDGRGPGQVSKTTDGPTLPMGPYFQPPPAYRPPGERRTRRGGRRRGGFKRPDGDPKRP